MSETPKSITNYPTIHDKPRPSFENYLPLSLRSESETHVERQSAFDLLLEGRIDEFYEEMEKGYQDALADSEIIPVDTEEELVQRYTTYALMTKNEKNYLGDKARGVYAHEAAHAQMANVRFNLATGIHNRSIAQICFTYYSEGYPSSLVILDPAGVKKACGNSQLKLSTFFAAVLSAPTGNKADGYEEEDALARRLRAKAEQLQQGSFAPLE